MRVCSRCINRGFLRFFLDEKRSKKIKAPFSLLENYGFAFIRDQSHYAMLHSLIAPVKALPCFLTEIK